MMNEENRPPIQVITLEADILEENSQIARRNRADLTSKGVYTINLISSPGSGKTSLLVETLNSLKHKLRCAVIEGDQRTSNDAERIAETGVPVIQVNTQQACHLNAEQVRRSIKALPLTEIDLLIIENVGNLICPADYDLGEDEKIALMSITEGEDKPLKYPLIFHLASILLLTKMDLLPHLRFNLEGCKENALKINPNLAIIETSVYDKQGIETWNNLLLSRIRNGVQNLKLESS